MWDTVLTVVLTLLFLDYYTTLLVQFKHLQQRHPLMNLIFVTLQVYFWTTIGSSSFLSYFLPKDNAIFLPSRKAIRINYRLEGKEYQVLIPFSASLALEYDTVTLVREGGGRNSMDITQQAGVPYLVDGTALGGTLWDSSEREVIEGHPLYWCSRPHSN